jgi:hypothetical protein
LFNQDSISVVTDDQPETIDSRYYAKNPNVIAVKFSDSSEDI